MPPKRNSKTKKQVKPRTKKLSDGIDVSTDADLAKLSDLLKKHRVVVVLVHADWCGHCQTFKPLWDEYKKIPGRTVPMASVNERMLSKTPFKDAKLDGYPSTLVYSGKDGSFGSFTNEQGEETHAVPNSRDKKVMTKLLRASPSMMRKMNSNSNSNSNSGNQNSETALSTPEANLLREASGKRVMRNKDIPIVNVNDVLPPNTDSNSAPTLRATRRRTLGGY